MRERATGAFAAYVLDYVETSPAEFFEDPKLGVALAYEPFASAGLDDCHGVFITPCGDGGDEGRVLDDGFHFDPSEAIASQDGLHTNTHSFGRIPGIIFVSSGACSLPSCFRLHLLHS
jgi:hypothetical protein